MGNKSYDLPLVHGGRLDTIVTKPEIKLNCDKFYFLTVLFHQCLTSFDEQ